MPLHKFLHNLLNVPVQFANKMGLQKKKNFETALSAGVGGGMRSVLD
jgi:hypothetical protein